MFPSLFSVAMMGIYNKQIIWFLGAGKSENMTPELGVGLWAVSSCGRRWKSKRDQSMWKGTEPILSLGTHSCENQLQEPIHRSRALAHHCCSGTEFPHMSSGAGEGALSNRSSFQPGLCWGPYMGGLTAGSSCRAHCCFLCVSISFSQWILKLTSAL